MILKVAKLGAPELRVRSREVDPKAIFTQAPKGSPTAPMFNDLRQKVVVFPDVRAGDTSVERGDPPAAAQRLDHRGAAEEGRPTDDEQMHGSTLAGRSRTRQGRSPRAQR